VALAELGRWAEALESLTQATNLEPKNDDFWNRRGVCEIRLGHFREALADVTVAIGLNAKNSIALRNKGAIHAELSQWDRANADYLKSLEVDPGLASNWSEHALLCAASGDRDGNRKACERAVDLFSETNDPPTALSLVRMCLRLPDALPLEDYALLEDLLDRVVARHSERGQYLAAHGLYLYRTGQFSEAGVRLEESLKVLKDEARIEPDLVLALTRYRLGSADRVKAALEPIREQIRIESTATLRGPDGGVRVSWPRRREHEIILKEATSLIEPK
jgi:tetratricopeptide (TPR) repeat protein